jgi:hypothetical protein
LHSRTYKIEQDDAKAIDKLLLAFNVGSSIEFAQPLLAKRIQKLFNPTVHTFVVELKKGLKDPRLQPSLIGQVIKRSGPRFSTSMQSC